MNSLSLSSKTVTVFVFVLLAAASIAYGIMLVPHLGGAAGMTCVLRNWAENGYSRLHGHVVLNPGGLEPGEQPYVLAGYRAYSLLPVYGLYQLTGRIDVAAVVFFVLVTLVGGLSIWLFLGRNSWALLFAVAFGLCPAIAYVAGEVWEPVGGTCVMGVPVALLFVKAVECNGRSCVWPFCVFLCVALYSQMEWASGFALIMGWVTLVVLLWRRNRRRLFWATVFLGVLACCGTIPLMFQKAAASTRSLTALVLSYTIGTNPAYDPPPCSWPVALKRLSFAHLAGCLPLWVLFVNRLVRAFRQEPRRAVYGVAPLLAGWGSILILRNYMGYQQWCSTPIICVGIILSAYLIHSTVSLAPSPQPSPAVVLGWSSVFFSYSLLVVIFLQVDRAEARAVVNLVNDYTARHDVILVGPQLARVFGPMGGKPIDRKVVFEEETAADRQTAAASRTPRFALDSVPMPGFGEPIAVASVETPAWCKELSSWYHRRITQRDSKTWGLNMDKNYYLYKLSGPPTSPRANL